MGFSWGADFTAIVKLKGYVMKWQRGIICCLWALFLLLRGEFNPDEVGFLAWVGKVETAYAGGERKYLPDVDAAWNMDSIREEQDVDRYRPPEQSDESKRFSSAELSELEGGLADSAENAPGEAEKSPSSWGRRLFVLFFVFFIGASG